MDIVCPSCNAAYTLDPEQVRPEGTALECTACGYVFRIRKRQAIEMAATIRPPEDARRPTSVGTPERSWMVRSVHGKLLSFDDADTLQKWIVEGELSRDAEISRGGSTWKRLGDIDALAHHFREADMHAHSSDWRTDSNELTSDHGEPNEIGAAVDVDEPAFARSGSALPSVGGEAAWERGGAHVNASHQSDDDFDDELPTSGAGKLIGFGAIAVLIAIVAGLAAMNPESFQSFFEDLFRRKRGRSEAYVKGRELLLRDDDTSLGAADRSLSRDESPRSAAARCEAHTVWAQHLLDRAELLDRQAQQLEGTAAQVASQDTPPPPKQGALRDRRAEPPPSSAAPAPEQALRAKAKTLRLRASHLRDEAAQKIAAARERLPDAREAEMARVEVYRARADLHRLEAKPDVLDWLRQARAVAPEDPECYYVDGLYWVQHNDLSRAITLFEAALDKTHSLSKHVLLRAAFQLSMLHLRSGRYAEARAQVRRIIDINPAHQGARALGEQLEREANGAPVAMQPVEREPPRAPPPEPVEPPEPPRRAVEPAAMRGRPAAKPTPARARPKAGKSMPNGYAALIKAGDLASQHGQTMRALTYYEQALKEKPKGVEAITGVAYCELDLQRFASATRRFKQAIAISTSHGDAMVGLAEAYRAIGDRTRALDAYRAYLRMHPSGRKASLARRNVKDLEEAIKSTPTAAPSTTEQPVAGKATPPPLPIPEEKPTAPKPEKEVKAPPAAPVAPTEDAPPGASAPPAQVPTLAPAPDAGP